MDDIIMSIAEMGSLEDILESDSREYESAENELLYDNSDVEELIQRDLEMIL